jgi:hypothetical protein
MRRTLILAVVVAALVAWLFGAFILAPMIEHLLHWPH